MSSPLRINFVLARPNLRGGVKSNRLTAEALLRRGHAVNIAFLADDKPWPSPLRARRFVRRLKQEVRLIGKPRHHLEHSQATLIPVSGPRIEPHHVPDADAVIAGWWETRQWIEHWPASKGVKAHLIRGHETYCRDPEAVRAVYRLPGLKFVTSNWLKRTMAQEYGDDSAVLIPNGIDWSQFQAPPRDKAPTPTVGLLYSPLAIKGAATAFEALRLAQRELPNLRVIAFGTSAIARRHDPPANFEYHHRPTQAQIPQIYQQADCWLTPSTTEGFGMPGLEAAACRCALVSTRCGGPEDYVEPGVNGYLVDVGAVQAMARALLDVVRLPAPAWRAMSDASRNIAEKFNWDRSAETLEQTLQQALRQALRQRRDEPAAALLGQAAGA